MFSFLKIAGATVVGVGIDFANWLAEGETITTLAVTGEAGIVTDSWISGTKGLATLTGGAAGTRYVLRYAIVGSLGTDRYAEIELNVVAATETCTVVADLKSLGLAPVPGVKLSVKSQRPVAINGAVVSELAAEGTTDAGGHVEVVVPQGITIDIDFPPARTRLTADTTAKATLHVADLLA